MEVCNGSRSMARKSSSLTGHTRTILLTSVGIAGGGYLAYRVYNSVYVAKKKQAVDKFFSGLGNLSSAISTSGDIFATIAEDLDEFLLSTSNEVPRSIRQLFKLSQAPEIQSAIAGFAESLTRGAALGAAKSFESSLGSGICRSPSSSSSSPLGFHGGAPPPCKWKLSVGGAGVDGATGDSAAAVWKKHHAGEGDGEEFGAAASPAGGNLRGEGAGGAGGFVDRIFDKMFSEGGKGFASAVVGSVARNVLSAYFEQAGMAVLQKKKAKRGKQGVTAACSGSMKKEYEGATEMEEEEEEEGDVEEGGLAHILLGFSCSKEGKALILDVVNSFVREAISVYIEQTKDINFYDDIVSSVTKPANREPVKDLMKTVCNEAVGTLVRTSFDVLSTSPAHMQSKQTMQRCHGSCHCDTVGHEPVAAITANAETSCCINYGEGEDEYSADGGDCYEDSGSTNMMIQRGRGQLQLGSREEEVIDMEDQETVSTSTPRVCGQDAEEMPNPSSPSGWKLHKGRIRVGGGGGRGGVGVDDHDRTTPCTTCSCSKGDGGGGEEGEGGREGWIDKACKVITVPSNREFVMDVAGAVSFQSVRAFIIAFNDVLRTQRQLPESSKRASASEDDTTFTGQQKGNLHERVSIAGQSFHIDKMRRTTRFVTEQLRSSLRREPADLIFTKAVKFVAAKALVCTSACLAICLHTLAGARTIEP